MIFVFVLILVFVVAVAAIIAGMPISSHGHVPCGSRTAGRLLLAMVRGRS